MKSPLTKFYGGKGGMNLSSFKKDNRYSFYYKQTKVFNQRQNRTEVLMGNFA